MRNSIDKNITGERIDKIITEKNLSEPQVAFKVFGNSKRRGDINKWRNKKVAPSAKYMPKLAKALRSISSIFNRCNRYAKY